MKAKKTPVAVTNALWRMRSRIRALWMATLIGCALLPLGVRAQASAAQVPYGLGGSEAWRENISSGIKLWMIADESARRAMLLNRCTALDRSFPAHPAPAMVAASTEVYRWLSGQAYTDLPPEPILLASRDVMPVLARTAFSKEELESWDALRASQEGQRGQALHEMEAALITVPDRLVDVNSGKYWSWPLARLNRLADAHGLRAETNAVFETLIPDSTERLRRISLVPGETQSDEQVLEQISRLRYKLAKQFVVQLGASDKLAYDRFKEAGVPQRWMILIQQLQRVTLDPASALFFSQQQPATVEEFCESNGLPSCLPGQEVHQAITAYRAEFMRGIRDDVRLMTAKAIVRKLPASGCPG